MIQAHRHAAAELLDARRARDAVFGEDREGFGEPAWDMLLYLLVHDGEGEVPVPDLLAIADVSPSVSLRYVDWLVTRDLIVREPNSAIAGETLVRLAERGRALMGRYFENKIRA